MTDTLHALLAAKEAAEAELHLMKTAGIIEVAVRNPSVSEYMEHWESRAEAAEAEAAALRDKLRAKIKHLHAQLPYFGVPHIREGLEDMLDVIGPREGYSDDG